MTCERGRGDDSDTWRVPADSVAFFYAPDLGLREWSVTMDVFHPGGNGPQVILGRQIHEFFTGRPDLPRTSVTAYGLTAAATAKFAFPASRWTVLSFERRGGTLRIASGDEWILEAADPDASRTIKDLEIHLAEGTQLRGFEVRGGGSSSARWRPKRSKSARRFVSIDFFDDTIAGAWTREGVEHQMRIYRKSGIERVYFLPASAAGDGFWQQRMPSRPQHADNILQTREAIGEFLPAFASAAKAQDLEFFAVSKPFDEAFPGAVFPPGSGEAEHYGRLPSLSGAAWWASDWVSRNPGLRMKRHPDDLLAAERAAPVHRVVLRSEVPAPGIGFEVWGSSDNRHYCRLECKASRQGDCQIEFLLPPHSPSYLAVTRQPGILGVFGNRLDSLLGCYDAKDRPLPISFGIASDVSRRYRAGTFPQVSFAFDVNQVGKQRVDSRKSFWFMLEDSPLGVAVGYEPFLLGAPASVYPEVRQHWLEQIRWCFDCGCDGVDIRIGSHNRTFDWERYGYNDEVLAQVGHDAGPEQVRTFLGRCYSGFLRSARSLAGEHGRKLHLHLEHGFHPARLPCAMNSHFSWEEWLAEGMADEVTLTTHSAGAGIMPPMAKMATSLGIPFNVRPYFNGMVGGRHAQTMVGQALRDLENFAADGLNIYENAAFFAVNGQGMPQPGKSAPWWELLTGRSL